MKIEIILAVDGSNYSEVAVLFLKSHFMPKSFNHIILNGWDYPFTPPKLPVETVEKKYSKEMRKAAFMTHAVCVSGNPAEIIANTAHRKKLILLLQDQRVKKGIRQFFLVSVTRKEIAFKRV